MKYRDGHGRRIIDGPFQRAFFCVAALFLFPLVLLSLLVWPPSHRWGDKRYGW